jgi:hypothetical protein
MQGGPEKGYPMRVVVVVCGLCVGCVCVGCVCHRFGRYRTLSNNIDKAEKCIMQGGPEKGYPMRVVLTRAARVVLTRAAP